MTDTRDRNQRVASPNNMAGFPPPRQPIPMKPACHDE